MVNSYLRPLPSHQRFVLLRDKATLTHGCRRMFNQAKTLVSSEAKRGRVQTNFVMRARMTQIHARVVGR